MNFLKEYGKKTLLAAVTLALAMVLLNQVKTRVPKLGQYLG